MLRPTAVWQQENRRFHFLSHKPFITAQDWKYSLETEESVLTLTILFDSLLFFAFLSLAVIFLLPFVSRAFSFIFTLVFTPLRCRCADVCVGFMSSGWCIWFSGSLRLIVETRSVFNFIFSCLVTSLLMFVSFHELCFDVLLYPGHR